MHSQRDQYPHQHLKKLAHNQVHRHAQNPKQLLLRLLVLQWRHSRGITQEIKDDT
jgi:hypothetical protein